MNFAGLPDWLVGAGIFVGIAIATAVGRIGRQWGERLKSQDSAGEQVELAGAIVDSTSIKMLNASAEALNMELITARKEGRQTTDDLVRAMNNLGKRIESHEHAVYELTKEIIRRDR